MKKLRGRVIMRLLYINLKTFVKNYNKYKHKKVNQQLKSKKKAVRRHNKNHEILLTTTLNFSSYLTNK